MAVSINLMFTRCSVEKGYDKAMRETMTRRRYLDPIIARRILPLNLGGLCGNYDARAVSGSSRSLKITSLEIGGYAGDYATQAVSAFCHSLGNAIAKHGV